MEEEEQLILSPDSPDLNDSIRTKITITKQYGQCLRILLQLCEQLAGQETDVLKAEATSLHTQFRDSINQNLQQSEFLKAHFDDLVNALIGVALAPCVPRLRYHTAFKMLYSLLKVHELNVSTSWFFRRNHNFEDILELLEREQIEDHVNWYTRYVLTTWLEQLMPIFDLTKSDDSSEMGARQQLASRVETLLLRNVKFLDACQHVTSYALYSFLKRPTTRNALVRFKDAVLSDLCYSSGKKPDAVIKGYLCILAYYYDGPDSEHILAEAVSASINRKNRKILRSMAVLLTGYIFT